MPPLASLAVSRAVENCLASATALERTGIGRPIAAIAARALRSTIQGGDVGLLLEDLAATAKGAEGDQAAALGGRARDGEAMVVF